MKIKTLTEITQGCYNISIHIGESDPKHPDESALFLNIDAMGRFGYHLSIGLGRSRWDCQPMKVSKDDKREFFRLFPELRTLLFHFKPQQAKWKTDVCCEYIKDINDYKSMCFKDL